MANWINWIVSLHFLALLPPSGVSSGGHGLTRNKVLKGSSRTIVENVIEMA